MKKTLLALAVAGVVAAPAAMAEVTVYGLAHVSVDNVSSDDGDNDLNVSSRSSRVGVKAAEDLGGGLKAIAQMEWQVEMADDLNSDLKATNNITARNQIVGLAGGFGTVALGRHDTPYKMSTGKLDLFSDTAADYNKVIGTPAGLENRGEDVIAYLSPDFNGLSFQAAIVTAEIPELTVTAGEVTDASDDDSDAVDAMSVAVQYNAGPLFVAVAYESFEDSVATALTAKTVTTADIVTGELEETVTATSNKGHSGVRAGVGYDAGVAKIGFVYETASDVGNDDDDYDAWLLNAAIPVGGNNTVIAEYGVGEFDKANKETTLMAIGVAHNFSKSSSAYVAYGNVEVDNAGNTTDTDILTAGLVVKF